MDRYKHALTEADARGYLISETGGRWLACEVAWRRACAAQQQPTVVVTTREKYADVYLFLRNLPHADLTDGEVERFLDQQESADVSEGQVRILRGDRGAPSLFMGLSVSDLLIEEALALAPILVRQGRSLLKESRVHP